MPQRLGADRAAGGLATCGVAGPAAGALSSFGGGTFRTAGAIFGAVMTKGRDGGSGSCDARAASAAAMAAAVAAAAGPDEAGRCVGSRGCIALDAVRVRGAAPNSERLRAEL